MSSFEYKGAALTETTNWIFHRGKFASQIEPIAVTLSISTDTFTNTGTNPFANDDQVRLRSIDGNLPVPLEEDLHGQSKKYFVINRTATTFQLSLTSGGSAMDFTDAGTGSLIVWKADKGFDDTEQGLPTFVPEVGTTFNNISYIEFKLPSGSSDPVEQPAWQDFRIFGIGRRLMEYDSSGAEIGVVSGGDELLGNPALIIADNYLWNHKGKPSRLDWVSLDALKQAADVQILQKVNTTETATVNGITGRYFDNPDFTNQIISRLDATVNIADTPGDVPPAPGVDPSGFSIIWKAQLKARYTELMTFRINHDDGVQLYINGNLIIDQPTLGNHSATFSMVADELYDIEIRFFQLVGVGAGNHYYCQFYWSSTSQTEEIVPNSRLFPADEIVRRYRISLAFNTPTESSEVHERIMERVVGWDWTDDNGLIKFLPPDRAVAFAFKFDKMDDDSLANFVNRTFEKRLRSLNERENFKLGRFRNILLSLYPFQFVQADRENLRLFTNGEPSNSPYVDMGVMTESQAQRFLEMQMVIKTDPDHIAQLAGALSSSKLRKNQFITVTYYDDDDTLVVNQKYLVTFHAWGDSASRNDFSLLPIPDVYYEDEPVE